MKRFVEDIEDLSEKNKDLRRVLHTSKHLQLVLTSLKPGEETGDDVHPEHDHFFRVERGKGELVLEGNRIKLKSNDAVIVPAGAHHNVINTGEKPMKIFIIYSPPHDPELVVENAAGAEDEAQ